MQLQTTEGSILRVGADRDNTSLSALHHDLIGCKQGQRPIVLHQLGGLNVVVEFQYILLATVQQIIAWLTAALGSCDLQIQCGNIVQQLIGLTGHVIQFKSSAGGQIIDLRLRRAHPFRYPLSAREHNGSRGHVIGRRDNFRKYIEHVANGHSNARCAVWKTFL